MADTLILKAQIRDKAQKPALIRRAGDLPAVVYGFGIDNSSLTMNRKSFWKTYLAAGGNTLVDLVIDDKKPVKVLIQDTQLDPVSDEPIHADFFAVNLKETVQTEIPLSFIGESPAVVDLEGTLVTNKTEVEVKALPTDLISEIEVDISMLKTFEDLIRVSDLKVPSTIEILDDPEDVVALVNEPKSEEELQAELTEDTAAEAAAIEELGKDSEKPAEDGEEKEEATEEKTDDDKGKDE
jgi:large subunit ribosomal protein L25